MQAPLQPWLGLHAPTPHLLLAKHVGGTGGRPFQDGRLRELHKLYQVGQWQAHVQARLNHKRVTLQGLDVRQPGILRSAALAAPHGHLLKPPRAPPPSPGTCRIHAPTIHPPTLTRKMFRM